MKKMYAVMGMALLMSGAIYANVTVVNQTDTKVKIYLERARGYEPLNLNPGQSKTIEVGETKNINPSQPRFNITVNYKDSHGNDTRTVVFNSGTHAASNYEILKESDCTVSVWGSNGRYSSSTCNLKLD